VKAHSNNNMRAQQGKTISPGSKPDRGNSAPSRATKKLPAPSGAAINRITTEPGSRATSAALVPAPNCQSLSIPAKGHRAPKLEFDENGLLEAPSPSAWPDLTRSFGTEDKDSILALLCQMSHMVPISDPARSIRLNSAVATIHDIAPKDAFERALAVQFWGAQRLATKFLEKATDSDHTDEQLDGHINRFTKLSRNCCAITEALDRHRGKIPQEPGQRQMVVENVNVKTAVSRSWGL
jgi:hypothetical protein